MNGLRIWGFSFLCMLAPAWAQPSNVLTRIDSSPAGGGFYVDGTYYTGATTAVWPAYSRHTLFVPLDPQTLGQINVQAGFTGWTWKGGGFADNPLIVTADPGVTEYTAHFVVSYAL